MSPYSMQVEGQRAALRTQLDHRGRLVGAAVASGMSAAAAEEGGADFIVVLSAGYFRLHGVGSAAAFMPYANANDLTWQMARHSVIPRLHRTPVFLGLCAQDPGLDVDAYLGRAQESGVVGITNFPTAGLLEGETRAAWEEEGFAFAREIDLLARAKARGFLTMGFCRTPEDAAALARVPVDIYCLNVGIADWRGVEGAAHQAALDQAVGAMEAMTASIRTQVADPVCIASGGPVILPQDAAFIFQRTDVVGYLGGSSFDRFPTASAITQTVREFKQVSAPSKDVHRLGAMVGRAPAMQQVFETIRSIAASDASILIIGESGTGKELAAREIHRLSHLHNRPLVSWNCGAITEGLAMSELFGHERGAFTGATRAHVGKFELANGGTLFMDEVTDLPLSVQASLLRVLQQGEIVRVGGEKTVVVSARIIAASNQEFTQLIPERRFRLDLYYRLGTITLRMPPLRDRPDDIPTLTREVAHELAQKYGRPPPRLADALMSLLVRHTWPGNIRELRNTVERMFLLKNTSDLTRSWLDDQLSSDRALSSRLSLSPAAQMSLEAKRARLGEVLRRHDGNRTAAARELGVTRKTVHKWLRLGGD